jgi:hypothetical protein
LGLSGFGSAVVRSVRDGVADAATNQLPRNYQVICKNFAKTLPSAQLDGSTGRFFSACDAPASWEHRGSIGGASGEHRGSMSEPAALGKFKLPSARTSPLAKRYSVGRAGPCCQKHVQYTGSASAWIKAYLNAISGVSMSAGARSPMTAVRTATRRTDKMTAVDPGSSPPASPRCRLPPLAPATALLGACRRSIFPRRSLEPTIPMTCAQHLHPCD